MSEENVELIRAAMEALNRRDFNDWVAFADTDIEARSLIVGELEGGEPYHGHDGLRAYWDRLFGLAPDMNVEIDEIRVLGDFTVSRIHIRGHGIESDAPIDQVAWQIAAWRNGKCVRLITRLTEAEALEAAGLSESAMSEENVEIARSGIAQVKELYRTGDFSEGLFRLRELCDPDFVLRPSGMFPEHEEMHGPEGLLKFIRGQTEAFERMWIEAEEFLDAGDRVVIPIRFGGRARHTGLDVEFQVTHLCTYREGKLLRDEIYPTKAEALEAAGLSE